MSRQITLRVSPQQLAAYEAAAINLGNSIKYWAGDTLQAAVGKRKKRIAFQASRIESEAVRDQKLAIWLSDQLESLIDEAADKSRISATTLCTLILDTAAGISQLSHYLKRVS
jgi:predicted HicB family RNase H-like nuclease